jgi:hypothetical protein
MKSKEFEAWLKEAIYLMNEEEPMINRVDTFEEASILSGNDGLVIKTEDGEEFQITIVKSK